MRTVKLSSKLAVTIGKIVNVDLHPSGERFNGPARITSAFVTNGRPTVMMISLADPVERLVARSAVNFAD